jgi:asparagine synthase (glutamine-hydrolysing)
MCGIVAQHGGTDPAELERMLERIAHRGPDDRGTVQVNGSWLGHRRLSIVDVDGGKQPLRNEDADVFLVGNGEVYNHEDVRQRLEGREILSDSDNEVALHLLDEFGPEALHRLNGMFAFVLATEDGRFVAARDPVGIKPLYWTPPEAPGDPVLFASEMHAFKAELQPRVEPFPPGYAWTPEDGLVHFASAVPDEIEPLPDGTDLVAGTRDVLVRAIERQMMGDVPVGVFLSGGLDSSIVAAVAARWCDRRGLKLHTFAVGTEASPDLLAARRVAEYLDTDHHEIDYTEAEALESLPGVVRAIESFDPGLVRSAVPNYMLARMTRQHVRVVLTGEGADELFAGYEYLREFTAPEDLRIELERTVRSLHNLNLQRCDRVTMAHAVEARVPFLDKQVIAWALRVPPEAKLPSADRPEKALLRQAFDGWLPDEFLWREKAEFGDGSGARDVLTREVEAAVSDEAFEAERGAVDPPLRTKEELAYYRVWREHLEAISPERTLSRFARA